MNTKDKVIRLLLTLTVIIWGSCVTFAEVVYGNDGAFSWSFDESTGTLIVNGSGELNQEIAPAYQESVVRLNIGEGFTSIQEGTFNNCSALLEITLPSTLESIANNVFSSSYIGIIRSQREYPPTIGNNTFRTDKTFCYIIVPEFAKKLYAKADYWKEYENILQGDEQPEVITGSCGENISYSFLPGEWILNITGTGNMDDGCPWYKYSNYIMELSFSEGITKIGNYTCQNMPRIKKVAIPSTVTSVGSYAFSNTKLSEISLPNGLLEIGAHAFSGCYINDVSLPETLESIGDNAFSSTLLQSVVLPESCKTLGVSIFAGCSQLLTAQLPKTLNSIPRSMFDQCVNLTSVNMPETLQTIENASFRSTALEEVAIPLSVTSIGNAVFQYCTSLKKASLPNSITTVPMEAFSGCRSLYEVALPSSTTEIGRSAFSGCQSLESIALPSSLERINDNAFYRTGLKSISVPDNVSYVGANVFTESKITKPVFNESIFIYMPREGFEEYAIPESITVVNATSFEGCSTISKISMTNVKTIGDRAFANCGLTSLELPNSVMSIGADAFYGCSNLNGKVDLSNNANLTELPDGLFAECKKLDKVMLPTSILSIGARCFQNCEELEDLAFPEHISHIGSRAFENCMSIEKFVFSKSNFQIGSYAFAGCINLIEATFNEGLTSITEKSIFNNCTKLEKVSFPETLNSIDLFIFTGCSKLDSLYFLCETAPALYNWSYWGSEESYGSYWAEQNLPFANCVICVPSRSTDVWKRRGSYIQSKGFWSQDPWLSMKFAEFYEKLSGSYQNEENSLTWDLDTEKGDLKISGNGIIPNNIGWWKRHFSIKNIIVEGDFQSIQENTFKDCINLEQVTLSETIEEIGNMAFACTFGLDMWNKLKSIVLPEKLKKLGNEVFSECERLEYVQMPDSLVEIGTKAFAWCHNLKEISIPRTVTSIGASAFHECYGLRDMYSHLLAPIAIDNNKVYANYVNPSECTLHVHVGTKNAYLATPGWEGFGSIVEEYADVNVSCDENGTVTGGGEYKVGSLATITAIPNEKYKFVKWSDETTDNPYTFTVSNDNSISAIMAPDTHRLIYIIDGDTIALYNLYEGDQTEIPTNPTKEGYTFSGWSEIPETMPAHDVTIIGLFTVNTYTLTYTIDGKLYKTSQIDYGTAITPEEFPSKEGYTFSGWSEIPETMPAHDVTVSGSFIVNKYQITYIIDGEVYTSEYVEFGATIVPPTVENKEGYLFSGWSDVPDTMPAHDITIYGVFTSGIKEIMMSAYSDVRIYSPNGKRIDKLQKGLNIVILVDGTIKKVVVK
ncbi:MAG: leucine-rich repeat protein [Prevotella sp.]|nr:leucine-rich repeat protein [Prevotella sp.]